MVTVPGRQERLSALLVPQDQDEPVQVVEAHDSSTGMSQALGALVRDEALIASCLPRARAARGPAGEWFEPAAGQFTGARASTVLLVRCYVAAARAGREFNVRSWALTRRWVFLGAPATHLCRGPMLVTGLVPPDFHDGDVPAEVLLQARALGLL